MCMYLWFHFEDGGPNNVTLDLEKTLKVLEPAHLVVQFPWNSKQDKVKGRDDEGWTFSVVRVRMDASCMSRIAAMSSFS